MKRFILLLALFISLTASAQIDSFSVDDGRLYWQRIYQTELSFDGLSNLILKDGRFVDFWIMNDEIACRTLRITPDFNALGFNKGLVPMYISGSDITGSVTIQFKEGRYRVTVTNIRAVQNVTGGFMTEGEGNPIETWAVKEGALTRGFCKTPAAVLDAMFTGMFRFLPPEHLNDNW